MCVPFNRLIHKDIFEILKEKLPLINLILLGSMVAYFLLKIIIRIIPRDFTSYKNVPRIFKIYLGDNQSTLYDSSFGNTLTSEKVTIDRRMFANRDKDDGKSEKGTVQIKSKSFYYYNRPFKRTDFIRCLRFLS